MMAARTTNGLPPALDESSKSLYVGNLDPRVTDSMLGDIFRTIGEVTHVKIIPDKNNQHGGLNYGFVDFADHQQALTALETLHGRSVLGHEIKVNWAYQGNNASREELANHFHVFVGDLSPDVTDAVLQKAFAAFGSLSDARVMWDMSTMKSRGYGFLAFREKADAERAIAAMNGEYLGSRAIRVNWANQRNADRSGGMDVAGPGPTRQGGPFGGPGAMSPSQHHFGSTAMPAIPTHPSLNYDVVVAQSSYANVTIYVGNLPPSVREQDLQPYFAAFGYVCEIRMQFDRGFAFVKMDTHEHAAQAICYLNGITMHGRSLKVSWGKDRYADQQGGAGIPPPAMQAAPAARADPYGHAAFPGAVAPYAPAAAAPALPPTQTGPIPPPDGSALPSTTDPIAAAAAVAAQAAVVTMLQQIAAAQQQQQTPTASTEQDAAAAYYAYYYQYYQQLAAAGQLPVGPDGQPMDFNTMMAAWYQQQSAAGGAATVPGMEAGAAAAAGSAQ